MLDSWLYMLVMFSLLVVISVLVPPLLAARKGYAWYLWTIAGGLLGLIILAFLPHVNREDEDPERNRQMRKTGNTIGAVLSAFGLGVILLQLLFLVIGILADDRAGRSGVGEVIKSGLVNLPSFAVYLLGIILAMVYWKQSPRRAGLVVLACLLKVFVTCASMVFYSRLALGYLADHGWSMQGYLTIVNLVGNLLHAMCWGLLLWAVFLPSRHSASDDPILDAEAPNSRQPMSSRANANLITDRPGPDPRG